MIYIPLLIMEFKARYVSYIINEDETDQIKFQAEYTMDTDKFWEVATGIFAMVLLITVVIWLAKVYIWNKNNPKTYLQDSHTGKLILRAVVLLLGTFSFMFFWYLFAFCGYWFVFYKMQYHVYVLMPSLDDYEGNYLAFEVLFYIVAIFQMLWVIDIIV